MIARASVMDSGGLVSGMASMATMPMVAVTIRKKAGALRRRYYWSERHERTYF